MTRHENQAQRLLLLTFLIPCCIIKLRLVPVFIPPS